MPDDAPLPQAGTRTTVSRAEGATHDAGLRVFFTYRDLAIAGASGGAYGANVIRAIPGVHAQPHWHTHELAFQMVFILKGWVKFEYGISARSRCTPAMSSISRRWFATAKWTIRTILSWWRSPPRLSSSPASRSSSPRCDLPHSRQVIFA